MKFQHYLNTKKFSSVKFTDPLRSIKDKNFTLNDYNAYLTHLHKCLSSVFCELFKLQWCR